MVAYEDLVVALTNWRINQGLPTGAEAFAAFETGSVDLALPVADPVELNTSEVLALEDDGDIEASDDAEISMDGIEEEAVMVDPGTEPESLESFAEADADADVAFDAHDGGALDYADETAYGDMPDMDAEEAPAAEAVEAVEAVEAMDAESADVAQEDGMADLSYEEVPADAPLTEEVDVLAAEEAIDQEISADEMPVEEFASEEAPVQEFSADEMPAEEISADEMPVEEISADAMPADEMPVEEEVDADNFDAEEISADGMEAEAEADDAFSEDEVPTRFGDDDDESEATVMGIGVDKLVPPDEV